MTRLKVYLHRVVARTVGVFPGDVHTRNRMAWPREEAKVTGSTSCDRGTFIGSPVTQSGLQHEAAIGGASARRTFGS